MPYLGHRDSDYVEMGVSASADASAAPVDPLADRAQRVVGRLAHDHADRQLLLEILGLAPGAVDVELAAAG